MGIKKVLFILVLIVACKVGYGQVNFIMTSANLCDSVDIIFSEFSNDVVATSWQWKVNGIVFSTLKITAARKFGPGVYTITLTVNGSASIDSIIRVHSTPVANFNVSRIRKTGYYSRFFTDSSVLDTIQKAGYWHIIDYGDNKTDTLNNNTFGFLHKYLEEGQYSVKYKVYDTISYCIDSITKTIAITDTSGIYSPNIFTPNGDGINDAFIIEGNGVDNLTIEIYTRQGMRVFNYSAPTIQWDGRTLGGSDAPSGVYFYILTSEKGLYNNEPVKSSLYLLREDK